MRCGASSNLDHRLHPPCEDCVVSRIVLHPAPRLYALSLASSIRRFAIRPYRRRSLLVTSFLLCYMFLELLRTFHVLLCLLVNHLLLPRIFLI